MKKTITPAEMEAVIEQGKKTWAELREGFKPEKLTADERANILAQFDKLEVMAYKCKIGVWAKEIQSAKPSISFKETLVETLKKLPDTLSVAALKELIDYTEEAWKEVDEAVPV